MDWLERCEEIVEFVFKLIASIVDSIFIIFKYFIESSFYIVTDGVKVRCINLTVFNLLAMGFNAFLRHGFHFFFQFFCLCTAFFNELIHLLAMFIDQDGHDFTVFEVKCRFERQLIVNLNSTRDETGTSDADVIFIGEILILLIDFSAEYGCADRSFTEYVLNCLSTVFLNGFIIRGDGDDIFITVHIDVAGLDSRFDESFNGYLIRQTFKVKIGRYGFRILIKQADAYDLFVFIQDEFNAWVDVYCSV